jgi:hypothetical protein
MPYRGDRWSLAGALMVGVAAVVVVVVAITAGSGEKYAAPPRPSAPVESPIPKQPLSGFGFSAVDDPSAHQLVLFGRAISLSRSGFPQLIGSFAAVWDDVLPPTPEAVWQSNLDHVVEQLRKSGR